MHIIASHRRGLLLEQTRRLRWSWTHLRLDLYSWMDLDAFLIFICIAAAWSYLLSPWCSWCLLFGIVDLVVRSHEDIAFEWDFRWLATRNFFLTLDGELQVAFFDVHRWGGVDGGEFLAEGGGGFAVYALLRLFNFIHHLRGLHIIMNRLYMRRALICIASITSKESFR